MALRRSHRLNSFIAFGLFALVVANLANVFARHQFPLSEPLTDAALGFLYGVAIAAMVIGTWRQHRARRPNGCA